jgi:hypothetical protein
MRAVSGHVQRRFSRYGSTRYLSVASFILLSSFAIPSFAQQITEKSGKVSVTQTGAGQTIETGADARAQIDLGTGVIRLGANSTVRAGGNSPPILVKGTVVFDFGKRGQELLFEGTGRQAKVSGGTGLASVSEGDSGEGGGVFVAALAGKSTVTMNGKTHRLRAGELAVSDAQGNLKTAYFNLAKLSESGSLLKDFQSPLPGNAAIQREVRHFASLQRRGFVRSGNGTEAYRNQEGVSPSLAETVAGASVQSAVFPGGTTSGGTPLPSGATWSFLWDGQGGAAGVGVGRDKGLPPTPIPSPPPQQPPSGHGF